MKNHTPPSFFEQAVIEGAALGLTLTSAYCSVVGFNSIFGQNDPLILTIAACLELGKVAVTLYLAGHWGRASLMQRIYMPLAVIVLMAISGIGAYGYFAKAFGASKLGHEQAQERVVGIEVQLMSVSESIAGLNERINSIPKKHWWSRNKLAKQLPDWEKKKIHLEAELSIARSQGMEIKQAGGPLIMLAEKTGTDVDTLSTYLILAIVLVFDPLAIALMAAFSSVLRGGKSSRMSDAEATAWAQTVIEDVDSIDSGSRVYEAGTRAVCDDKSSPIQKKGKATVSRGASKRRRKDSIQKAVANSP